jgi:hypothetical protein
VIRDSDILKISRENIALLHLREEAIGREMERAYKNEKRNFRGIAAGNPSKI